MFCSVGCEDKAKDYLTVNMVTPFLLIFFFLQKCLKKHYMETVENICFIVVFVVVKEINSWVLLNCVIYNHFPLFIK